VSVGVSGRLQSQGKIHVLGDTQENCVWFEAWPGPDCVNGARPTLG
jgi:hypothetical protein